MKRWVLILAFSLSWLLWAQPSSAQSYISYLTGDSADAATAASFGICLMGGGTEHDEAMRWFLNRSGGGDVVVIRATGADGYNAYLYSALGVSVNSVETIVIPSASAANDPYVEQQLGNAEAIWIAGGDQYDYVSYWKNTKVDSLLNHHINVKQAPLGGTSAGMAILGEHYFSAANGTVTSAGALNDPYNTAVTLGYDDFIHAPFLQDVITDTHYDNPDRKGRHTAFLARMVEDLGIRAFGIACDEYTAVCIDAAGVARVFGEYPAYDDNAYFLMSSCYPGNWPEVCNPGSPLTWIHTNNALKVYAVKGDFNGTNSFDLSDWQTGSGGTWQHWWVSSGQFYEGAGSQPPCTTGMHEPGARQLVVGPNPASNVVHFSGWEGTAALSLFRIDGTLAIKKQDIQQEYALDIANLADGVYILELAMKEYTVIKKLLISK